MEATQVTQHIKVLSQVAVTLSTEERMQLEYAFDQLQSAMKFESLHLWGKIQGKSTSDHCLSQNCTEFIDYGKAVFDD